MSNFTSFTSKINLIVIKLLHNCALRPNAGCNHQFVIEFGVIVSLIYCHLLTIFNKKLSFKTKVVTLRCFFKRIVSTNVLWYVFDVAINFSSSPRKCHIASQIFNFSPLPVPFFGYIGCTDQKNEITKKSRKTSNSSLTYLVISDFMD